MIATLERMRMRLQIADAESRCGGPGSGVPGPCPGSKKDKTKDKDKEKEKTKKEKPKAKGKKEKSKSGQPITPQEAKSLKNYTKEAYVSINKDLRAGKEPKEESETYKDMKSVFEKTEPLSEPMTVYRGMNFNKDKDRDEFISKLSDAKNGGKGLNLAGYTSTTSDKNMAKNFMEGKPGRDVHIEIEAKKGVDLSKYSKYPKEKEFLLDHNSKFKVSEIIKHPNGSHTVRMKQVLK